MFSPIIQTIPPRHWDCTMSFLPVVFGALREVFSLLYPFMSCWVGRPDFGVSQRVEACLGKNEEGSGCLNALLCFRLVDGFHLVPECSWICIVKVSQTLVLFYTSTSSSLDAEPSIFETPVPSSFCTEQSRGMQKRSEIYPPPIPIPTPQPEHRTIEALPTLTTASPPSPSPPAPP